MEYCYQKTSKNKQRKEEVYLPLNGALGDQEVTMFLFLTCQEMSYLINVAIKEKEKQEGKEERPFSDTDRAAEVAALNEAALLGWIDPLDVDWRE